MVPARDDSIGAEAMSWLELTSGRAESEEAIGSIHLQGPTGIVHGGAVSLRYEDLAECTEAEARRNLAL
jgi:hypothetical protein